MCTSVALTRVQDLVTECETILAILLPPERCALADVGGRQCVATLGRLPREIESEIRAGADAQSPNVVASKSGITKVRQTATTKVPTKTIVQMTICSR